MANSVLNSILKDYEQKRLKAELELEKRKEKLYSLYPRLEEIENELSSSAISTAKSILQKDGKKSLKNLNAKIDSLKKEKEDFLTSHGYDVSCLTPSYECSLCNDTGFVEENGKNVFCNCLKQRLLDASYASSNMSNLNTENFLTFDANLFSDKVNLSKYGQDISPRQNILNIRDRALYFVNHFDEPSTNNLLFTGNTGLGKSFMSSCIAAELIKKNKTVLYQTSSTLLEGIIDYKFSKNKNYDNNPYKSALECNLLIIDDLGTESLNSMKLDELSNLINDRVLNLNGKITKTIISTNLSLEDIFKYYEERMGSRIAGFYDIYQFFGDDLRFKKKRIDSKS